MHEGRYYMTVSAYDILAARKGGEEAALASSMSTARHDVCCRR